jgi:hypothetical protein
VSHVVSEREALLQPKAMKSAKKEQGKPVQEAWLELMRSPHAKNPSVYKPKQHFPVKAHLQHPQFGAGIVMKHIFPNKIEVLFEMDLKILIHAPQ